MRANDDEVQERSNQLTEVDRIKIMMLASNGNVTDIYGKERAAEDALVDEGGR